MVDQRAEEIRLDIPGLKLAGRAWGAVEGPPLLALHGWLDNAASFDALAPLLARYRLVALDLPGHGLSEHRHSSASYELVQWVPDVIWAADALGWPHFTLIGHSLGAAIAPLVAAAVPERVSALVLLDGLGPLTSPAADAADQLALAVADRRRLPPSRVPIYADREAAAARLREANPALSSAAARVLVERGTAEVENGVVWRHDPRLRAHSLLRLSEDQARAFLRATRCPTMIVRARQGWPASESVVRARLRCFRRATLRAVEGSHHVHLVHPERVAPLITGFLD